MKKIGILGGTFDPIHIGHLHLAKVAKEQLELDMVLFIPAYNSPFKEGKTNSFTHRLTMCALAIANESDFFVSAIEAKREGKSYTSDTLKIVKDMYKDCELYFLAGVDALNSLYLWHNWQEILKLCYFTVLARPNYSVDKNNELWRNEDLYRKIIFLDADSVDMSSTMLRDSGDFEGNLPKVVEEYIMDNDLYKD